MKKSTLLRCFLPLSLAALPAAQLHAEDDEQVRMGKRQFVNCVGCHTLDADARPRLGPHLEGIVGRPVASVAGFKYSGELAAQSFVWSEEQLDQWLEKPQDLVPKMCLPFMGIGKAEARQALITYLKNPQP